MLCVSVSVYNHLRVSVSVYWFLCITSPVYLCLQLLWASGVKRTLASAELPHDIQSAEDMLKAHDDVLDDIKAHREKLVYYLPVFLSVRLHSIYLTAA